MKHKFMLINSIDLSKEIENTLPPLGFGYLISSLRQHFGRDHIEFSVVDRDIEKEIHQFEPDIVGITSVSQNYNRAIRYAGIAKKFDLPVIIGGVHISALPTTLTNDMDLGVIGEGEQAIVELFDLFEKKGSFHGDDLRKIDGVVFRTNGELRVSNRREPIQPLDKIPMPDRDPFTIKKSTYMFTSRGCPYKCSFCASTRLWGNVRFFSAEYVVSEIEYLVKTYNVEEIRFLDDLFVAKRTRLKQIVDLLEEKGILSKVAFTCNARSNLVNDELASQLRRMKVKSVGMGLESGVPTTLEYLKGGNITVTDHKNALKILRKHGIKPSVSFIIGSPKETREEILQTFGFIKEQRLTNFDVYVLTPFPGTPVWDYAISRNLVSEDIDWDILNVNFGENHKDAIILSENLTREEIYKLFLLFVKEKTRIMIKSALRNPLGLLRNPKRVLKAIKKILSRKPLTER